ncbi:uncharacterized protein UTRI_06154 [Ustilago trichophora]|uniref:Uncharacterized protein n=1 Tax=Ustilago trichophora TaxID=86804 RepID=A0A5C3EGL4_9BASI|nr:uncharacterized protein UTRI_06154 [Ustilago trichophora]
MLRLASNPALWCMFASVGISCKPSTITFQLSKPATSLFALTKPPSISGDFFMPTPSRPPARRPCPKSVPGRSSAVFRFHDVASALKIRSAALNLPLCGVPARFLPPFEAF